MVPASFSRILQSHDSAATSPPEHSLEVPTVRQEPDRIITEAEGGMEELDLASTEV